MAQRRSRRVSAARLIAFAVALLCASPVMVGVLLPQTSQGSRAPRKVRVSDPARMAEVERRGGRLVADYGSYRLYELGAAAAARASASGGAELLDEFRYVLLNTGPIDTSNASATAQRGRAAERFGGRRTHLVQLVGPTRPEWYQALRDTGVEVVSYVPHNAYLVYGDEASLGALRELTRSSGFVQWDGPYRPEHRLQPGARGRGRGRRPDSAAWDVFAVQLVKDPVANAGTLQVVDGLRRGPIRSRFEVENAVNVILSLDPAGAERLAERPDVVSIQPFAVPQQSGERQSLIVAGEPGGSTPGAGYLSYLSAWGFTAQQFATSGFAVDISDSGIDDGTTTPNHPGLYDGGDTSGQSRVVYNRLEGSPLFGNTIEGCDGHGTVNAHIVAGYSDLSGFPFTDGAGFHYGLGVAPFVRVGSSVIFAPDYIFPSFPDLHSRAYQDGARISSNSWGGLVNGAYDVQAQLFDALTRDAQPAGAAFSAPGNQEMVMVVAAGNEGPFSIRSPGTAKNVITVGASENVHPFFGADGCGVPDSGADSAEDLASFSSGGPTADQRKKPDLVAPGTHVSGGVFQTEAPGATGQADSCFDGTGVCGGVGSPFFPAGQQFYTASSGTSHSTPAVAGGAALVRQHFVNQALPPPSPAMTKAYLINSTRYLTGVGAGGDLWSDAQGMGGLDLGAAFDGASRILRDQVPSETLTASGQTRTLTGSIADPGRPFRVTLAWTDAPGSTTGDAFNNDLDLTVTLGGVTYKGNVFSGPYSAAGGSADLRNNVESVFLPAGASGEFGVTVTAANINSDGVPGFGGALDQDYALVVYNGDEIPVPILAPAGASLVSEGCGAGNGAIDPGETVTVDLSVTNLGTGGAGDVVGTLLETGGVVAPSAPQSFGSIGVGDTVTRPFSFTAQGTCGGVLSASLSLEDGGADLGSVSFDFDLGTQAPGGPETTFANPGSVFIDIGGPAVPYPTDIAVSGLEGKVAGVKATLHGFTHAYPDDVDVLLVAPDGRSVVLMSDGGGGGAVSGLTLTFDDAAAAPLPDAGPLVTGSYRPADWEGATDEFPAPAPGGTRSTTLAGLAGGDPNGTWSLYVVDDFFIDGGSIAGGWSLDITTTVPVCCAGAAAVAVSPTSGLVTSEAGAQASFSVALTTTPTDDVTIGISSSDPSEGTASPAALTFTPANALTPQLVTVTGSDDGLRDGDVAYEILTSAAVSADPAYAGLDPPDVAVTNADDEPLPPTITPAGSSLLFESCGPANGVVDPGESVTVELALANAGPGPAVNLVATLQETGGVTSPSGPQSYGILGAGDPAVARPFSFTAAAACGGVLTATLDLQDDYSVLGSVSFDLDVGGLIPGGDETVFSNPSFVFIDLGGPASPYPSPIEVSGLPGDVTGVTVTLDGLSHTYPDDLDVLLVAPGGQSVLLMSDAGGGGALSDVTLTFDDGASAPLPDAGPLVSGSYRPANYEGALDEFFAPAPAGPYGGTLASLNGADPNGTWSLYVVDDFFVDEGNIARGWSLAITTSTPDCCVSSSGFAVNPTSGLVTSEAGGSASFSVALTTVPTADVVVGLASSDSTEGDVSPASLTFTPLNALAPQTVTVTGVDDAIADGDVAYAVLTAPAVSADSGYAGLDPPDVAAVNLDDDVVAVSIGDVQVAEGDAGTLQAVFAVTLSAASSADVSVDFATADGTAVAGEDYQAASGNLILPAGTTAGAIGVDVNGDVLYEPDETFFVDLANPSGATIADGQGVGTIANDDPEPTLSIDDVGIVEGNAGTASAAFTLSLSGPSSTAISVDWSTADGSATAGSDYAAASGTASFAPGATTAGVSVAINGDVLYETDETFFVNLANPSGATIADAQGVGTIANDEPEPILGIDDVSVVEGDAGTASAVFTVSLSGPSSTAISVDWSTADGSATAGSDYVAASGTASFTPGATTAGVSVTINGDAIYESDETFFVDLANPSGAVIGDGQGVGTIANDDAPPTLGIDDVVVTEGDSGSKQAVFTLALSVPSGADTSVDWTTSDGSATAGSDYAAASGTASFAPGATTAGVSVTINGDALHEPDETFFVDLANPSGATIADGQGVGTIANDDPEPALSIDDVTVTEGDSGATAAQFTLSLSAPSGVAASVSWATADGSAVAGADYVAASGTVAFPPGSASASISVDVLGDTLFEGDETFAVLLSGASGASIADARGDGVITDDDPAPPATEPVVWTAGAGVAISGNSLEKTARTRWGNAGARSVQQIASGDGFVEFTASETNTDRALGLSTGDSNRRLSDIDFALRLRDDGTLRVHENGSTRGTFGAYAPGDRLRIAVEAGVVSYFRNGVVFYTSAVTPGSPLLVDTALRTRGATLTDVVVAGASP